MSHQKSIMLLTEGIFLEYYDIIIIDDFNRTSKINDLINNNILLFTQTQIKSHLDNLQNPNYSESKEI